MTLPEKHLLRTGMTGPGKAKALARAFLFRAFPPLQRHTPGLFPPLPLSFGKATRRFSLKQGFRLLRSSFPVFLPRGYGPPVPETPGTHPFLKPQKAYGISLAEFSFHRPGKRLSAELPALVRHSFAVVAGKHSTLIGESPLLKQIQAAACIPGSPGEAGKRLQGCRYQHDRHIKNSRFSAYLPQILQ